MNVRERLAEGLVIPAHPLALTSAHKLDERRQRALTRYYLAAGAGGIAVGVHTTQFAIRDPKVGLYRPVLELALEETIKADVVKIAGVCGLRPQALKEAEIANSLGYDAVLLSMGGLQEQSTKDLVDHARAIADVIQVVGFYLQPSVGGMPLSYEFWREFAKIENVVAIKMAPFNRYQTIDVLRGVIDSGRAREISLYTGNDDSILIDLITRWNFGGQTLRIAGGLLGHRQSGQVKRSSISPSQNRRDWRFLLDCLLWHNKLQTQTPLFSIPLTDLLAVLQAFTRYCVGKVFLKALGASMKTNLSRQARARRSTVSTRLIRISRTTPLCINISPSG